MTVNNHIAALVGGATSADEGTADVKDDLYLGVNGDWLKTAKIPADKPTTGGFADLVENIEKKIKELEKEIEEKDQCISVLSNKLSHVSFILCFNKHSIKIAS